MVGLGDEHPDLEEDCGCHVLACHYRVGSGLTQRRV